MRQGATYRGVWAGAYMCILGALGGCAPRLQPPRVEHARAHTAAKPEVYREPIQSQAPRASTSTAFGFTTRRAQRTWPVEPATPEPLQPAVVPPPSIPAGEPAVIPHRPAPRPSSQKRQPKPKLSPSRQVAPLKPLRLTQPITSLSAGRCLGILQRYGVRYDLVKASAISIPIRLQGPIGGVQVAQRGKRETVLDCRLAVALLAWAPTLRRAGVRRLLHYSTFRPGARVTGTRRRSGHASGMAIDAAEFELADKRLLSVLDNWTERRRGAKPCVRYSGEDADSRRMRDLVCGAVDRDLFQVVITPHHDRAHRNHVHLELVPGVDWRFVH